MEPNFVLMTLPGEQGIEFIEILPFTPANRNNLIGWIAGRSDGEHYGKAIVYDFPKTKLVDGPLQIEARIDQNAQLSGQLSLWNQQGSRVHPRQPDRHADRPRSALRGADLSAGRAQPDAGAPHRRARDAGPSGVRPDVRGRDGQPLRRRAVEPVRRAARAAAVRRGGSAAGHRRERPKRPPMRTRSSPAPRRICRTISASPPKASSATRAGSWKS